MEIHVARVFGDVSCSPTATSAMKNACQAFRRHGTVNKHLQLSDFARPVRLLPDIRARPGEENESLVSGCAQAAALTCFQSAAGLATRAIPARCIPPQRPAVVAAPCPSRTASSQRSGCACGTWQRGEFSRPPWRGRVDIDQASHPHRFPRALSRFTVTLTSILALLVLRALLCL